MAKRVVFLGTGHAHLYALGRLGQIVEAGGVPVVVAPGPFWYSGLATAVLGGCARAEQDVIDVASLVRRAGGTFVQATVSRLTPGERMVHLMDGPPLAYDLLSLALGSVVVPIAVEADSAVFPVKPIARLADLHRALVLHGREPATAPLRVLVAGAGMTGCEVAANIVALGATLPRRVAVTVLASGRSVVPRLPPGPRRQVAGVLTRGGATIRCGARLASAARGVAQLASGERLGFDLLVNATGLVPSPLIWESGLPTDRAGALVVDATLRSPGDAAVHGGGDCIAFQGTALPRAGVYGVRQAPVLFNNILASLGRGRPIRYRPQRRALWVMNLGDGTGLASWGRLHWRGAAALRLKDWLDFRFLAAYRSPALDEA